MSKSQGIIFEFHGCVYGFFHRARILQPSTIRAYRSNLLPSPACACSVIEAKCPCTRIPALPSHACACSETVRCAIAPGRIALPSHACACSETHRRRLSNRTHNFLLTRRVHGSTNIAFMVLCVLPVRYVPAWTAVQCKSFYLCA